MTGEVKDILVPDLFWENSLDVSWVVSHPVFGPIVLDTFLTIDSR